MLEYEIQAAEDAREAMEQELKDDDAAMQVMIAYLLLVISDCAKIGKICL